MEAKVLTEKQKKILDYIRHHMETYKFAPTVREICAGTGIRSTSTVHLCLKSLASYGIITYMQGTRRAITLCEPEPADNISDKNVQIPVIGDVAAGQPILAVQNIQEYYSLPHDIVRGTKSDGIFMLRIKGESMIDIGMYENDFIIVNQSLSVDNGDIAVARIDDSVTVKRIFFEKNVIRLQPENSAMSPIYANLADVDIVGKVVGLIRNY